MFAPIVIFAFNRPHALQGMIESLKKNTLFAQSEIFVFIDGPRSTKTDDVEKISQVMRIAKQITSHIVVSEVNKGLGNSIIAGVSEIINRYGRAIVLEDDLKLMPGFLLYMNEMLDAYEADKRIFSVCGYGLKVDKPKNYKGYIYLGIRSSSWGWATWADRWNSVDWQVSDYAELLQDKQAQRAFNRGGSDMTSMLRGYMEGKNRSWAIRFCYAQFKQGKYSIHPFRSLVDNEGFGEGATNCKQTYSRFKVDCCKDSIHSWDLPQCLEVNASLIKQNYWYHSIWMRIYSKLRNYL